MESLKAQFMLDPDIVFLNHGSFGATPRPVFDVFQEWQRRFEFQPVAFVDREMPGYLEQARSELGAYINSPADNIVYIPNVTFAVNLVARSLGLGHDDEVLASNHEYGACDRTWLFLSQKRGFTYRRQPISLPITTAGATIEEFWRGVTPKTKVIFISHITSPTAIKLPVKKICKKAREQGILVIVDGAHAPGQISLDMRAIGADFYVGNCHKWLCGPKGSAFLYARPEVQKLIEPLVVSWGWGADRTFSYGSDYLDYTQWTGTNYPAAYLSVPAAIQFQHNNDWVSVRSRCHEMLEEVVNRISDMTGLPSIYPVSGDFFEQMAAVPLPPIDDLLAFKRRLYERYRVEIPVLSWQDTPLIRISIQGYNSHEDVKTLLVALAELLPLSR